MSFNLFFSKEKSFIANWETLQKKIQNLEDENVELRTEASHRMDDIEEVEKKELQLISDCVRELGKWKFFFFFFFV